MLYVLLCFQLMYTQVLEPKLLTRKAPIHWPSMSATGFHWLMGTSVGVTSKSLAMPYRPCPLHESLASSANALRTSEVSDHLLKQSHAGKTLCQHIG